MYNERDLSEISRRLLCPTLPYFGQTRAAGQLARTVQREDRPHRPDKLARLPSTLHSTFPPIFLRLMLTPLRRPVRTLPPAVISKRVRKCRDTRTRCEA